MFLSRFRVRGYKCLADVDVPLTPFHAIVGPSGCGKSSLLEAISALYGRLKTSPAQWFPAADSPRDWLTHDSSVPTIDLAGQWSENVPDGRSALAAGYGLSIVVPTSGQNLAVMDQWVRPRATDDPHSGLTRKAFAYPHASSNSTAEDRAAQAAFRDVVQSMLQPAPIYRLDARRLAEPIAADREERRSLDADGYGLAAVLQDIAARHAERFAEIETEFSRLLPMYCGLSIKMEPSKIKSKPPRGKTSLEAALACALCFKTFSGRQIAAREASSGAMLLLALVTLARLRELSSLLLIENPEQGIHLPLMTEVIVSLRKLAQGSDNRPQTQVIVTTHSPAVQSLFEPQETTLLSRPDERPDGPVVAKSLAE